MFKDSAEITRTAMGMLPVRDAEDLVEKLQPYKKASVKLLRELIRSVNTENQYKLLKSSEFNLSKAASVVNKPYDPEEILSMMDRKDTGMLKAASPVSFKSFRAIGKIRRKTASVSSAGQDMYALIDRIRKSADPLMQDRFIGLRITGRARYASIQNQKKAVADEISRIISGDRILSKKYAELKEFRTENTGKREVTVRDIVKWAQLNERLIQYMEEEKLIKYVLEG
ncbi:MAG: hypothetical protein WC279_12940 [Sulfurimonas sp.]|jgi:cell fate (sporulation/competence/biofilm development) regulator YlbF (YheA/YmcA/DUF963 family)|uniref:hypothetical protein n=1 Tax=Sulfurimonas sp. TaxID=2022749 RepID=UPI00356516E9